MSSSSDKSSEVLHASTVTGDAKVSPSPGVDSKNHEDTPHSDAVTAPHSTEESGAGSSSDGSSHGDHGHPHVVICFTFVGIVIGLLTTHFISRKCHGVPLTVALFVEGILLGYVHTITDGGLGVLSESLDMWLNIDPHLLLFAFLPALLFGDSMGLSWHEFCRCLSQCCLLAGPGVVIGASSTAVFAMFVLPYGWDMHTALAFGSIMAATDPVAVVALLKDMGCDKTLTMQIAGEKPSERWCCHCALDHVLSNDERCDVHPCGYYMVLHLARWWRSYDGQALWIFCAIWDQPGIGQIAAPRSPCATCPNDILCLPCLLCW